MPKAKVGDINMYYEIHGKGEPLVFIAGFASSLDIFRPVIPIFSREHHLVIFDNRGAGLTDAPDIPYTIEMMADDLAGLLDVIGIDSAHIQGASMGGMIAQEFALHYPERLRSLILACTHCGGPGSSVMTDPEVVRFAQRMPSLSGKELMMETLRICVNQEFIAKNPVLIQNMIKQMMKHPMTPQGSKRQGEVLASYNTYERLPEIKTPTLVISGDADKIVPVANSRIIASRIPGAELVILKGAGHMFNLEAGEEADRIMLDFLKRHSTKKA